MAEATATGRRRVTVEEWGRLDDDARFELVDGELLEKPQSAAWHEWLMSNLLPFLYPYFQGRRIGKVLTTKAKLKISNWSGREPDVFVIPTEQFHLVGRNLFHCVPMLVIEVLSSSTEKIDREAKPTEYARLGIPEYWIIDFSNRNVEVYRRDPNGAYQLTETTHGDANFQPITFPGLDIPLAELWPEGIEQPELE